MVTLPQLSLAEWIVLALIAEEPRHGFAVAALTAKDGDVGRAWQVPRPIVYRALARLTDLQLVRLEATEQGDRGPRRSVLAATPIGHAAVAAWLTRPVAHVRDVRSELLAKLALLARRGDGTTELLAAQRIAFAPIERALNERASSEPPEGEPGFDQVLATWRAENIRATLRFLDEVQA